MKVLRALGRILATVASAFWLFVIVVSGAIEGVHWDLESALMAALVLGNAAATGIAWWRPRLGAVLLLIGGLAHAAFALYSAGHNHALAMLISGGPFLLAGAAVLLASREAHPSD